VCTGLVSQEVLLFSAFAVPFAYLGARLGSSASERIDARRFQILVMGLLALSSIGMLVRGQPDRADASEPSIIQVTWLGEGR
jgi:uncharacterized membrane protein YfcA